MNRHCAAINETSNKKKHTGRELLNLETIRSTVHRTTVFGECWSHSPLCNDLLYHFYAVYCSRIIQPYSIIAATEDEAVVLNLNLFSVSE